MTNPNASRALLRRKCQFLLGMIQAFGLTGMSAEEALRWTGKTFKAYLEEMKCSFGDPDYDWSGKSGFEAAHMMEISYWE